MISHVKKTTVKMITIAICGIFTIAFAAQSNSSRDASGSETQKTARPIISVSIFHPEKTEIPDRIEAFGTVGPQYEISIPGEISGYKISRVDAEVGDKVKKGTLLAKYDDELLRIERNQAKAAFDQAKIKFDMSSDDARRAKALDSGSAISKQELTRTLLQAEMDSAAVDAAKASLDSIDFMIKKSRVVATADGIVSASNVDEGTFPAQGTELFRIVGNGLVEWRAEISDKDIGRIRTGQKAEMLIGGKQVEGTVRKISPIAETSSRTFIVYVDAPFIPNVSGTFSKGSILAGKRTGFFVPSSSVRTADGRASIPFVSGNVGSNAKVERKIVTVSVLKDGKRVEVSGIPDNAAVVVKGAGFLSDGDVVSITEIEGNPGDSK